MNASDNQQWETTVPTIEYIEGLIIDGEGVSRRLKRSMKHDYDVVDELVFIAKQAIDWKRQLDELQAASQRTPANAR